MAFALLYVAVSSLIGLKQGIALMLLSCFLLGSGLITMKITGLFKFCTHFYMTNCTFVAIFGCSYYTGGLYSPVTPWFTLVPVVAVLLLGYSREVLFWLLTSVLLIVVYGALIIQGFQFDINYQQEYSLLFGLICYIGLVLILFLVALTFEYNRRKAMYMLQIKNEALEIAHKKSEEAMQEIKTLQGIIPICSNCKGIRDDKGAWESIEKYMAKRTDVTFSHSTCPKCTFELYPDIAIQIFPEYVDSFKKK